MFTLWDPWISVPNSVPIHLVDVQIFTHVLSEMINWWMSVQLILISYLTQYVRNSCIICKKLPQETFRQFSLNTGRQRKQKRITLLRPLLPNTEWLPVDETLTREKFNIKKQIFEGAKATDEDFSEKTGRLTSENKNLTNSVAEGFALMRSVMSQCWCAIPPHYLPQSQTSNQPFGHFNLRRLVVA